MFPFTLLLGRRRLLLLLLVLAGIAVISTQGHGSPNRAAVVTASGHGWTAAGLQGPIPAPGSCHYHHGAGGMPLPDPACTPGAVDPAVTAATLSKTVCRPAGYTMTVRPPAMMTETIKRKIMAAYGIPWSQSAKYELDHLIPINAGGSSDTRNLWPESNVFLNGTTGSAFVHNDKDVAEAWTFHKLCAGQVDLAALQRAMAINWVTAVATLHLPRIPAGYRG